jgi:hypothetical protein
MGDIYRITRVVAVLLPEEDKGAFESLRAAVVTGYALLTDRARDFARNKESGESWSDLGERYYREQEQRENRAKEGAPSSPVPSCRQQQITSIGDLYLQYFLATSRFSCILSSSTYWSRAWTF